MMEEPKPNENTNETQYPIDPSAPIIEENIGSKSKEEKDSNETNKPHQIQPETEKVVVVIDKEKTIQPKIANIISFLGVGVSAALFYFTFLLFTETQKSTGAAIQMAKIADSSFQISKESIKYSDSINQENISIAQRNVAIAESTFRVNQSSFMSTDKSAKKSLEIAFRSLKTQNDNAEIARKSMEFEFRSDLILKTAKITQFAPDKPVEGICEFAVVGRFPVTVDSIFTSTTFAGMQSLSKFVLNPEGEIFKRLPPLRAVDKQYYKEVNSYTDMISKKMYLDKSVVDEAKIGGILIVYGGRIVYENPINGRKRYYKFAVVIPARIEPDPSGQTFAPIFMKNGDVN